MTEQTPTPPAPPASQAEAAARISELSANSEWLGKLMTGDGSATREFAALMATKVGTVAAADSGDRIDQVLKAPVNDGFKTVPGFGYQAADQLAATDLASREELSAISGFREAGVRDGVIKEIMTGRPATQAEHDAVRRLYTDKTTDSAWCERLLKGSVVEKRELILMHAVLNAPLRKEAAP